MKFRSWLRMAEKKLTASDTPKRDAEILLSHVTGKSRTFILAFDETQLTVNEMQRLEVLLAQRKVGNPVAYLVGECEFWSLPLYVSPVTLIPRPDTECLVEQALIRLPSPPRSCRVLDLGTGTGAIALAIASERPDCEIIAVDLLPEVVRLAQRNVNRLKLTNISVRQSYWFNELNGENFELIISNPPYIDAHDLHLIQGDVRFEPRTALVADNKGLADLNYIITQAKRYLNTNSWLLVEHGWQQGEIVRSLFSRENYISIMTCCDYGNNERLTLGCFSY